MEKVIIEREQIGTAFLPQYGVIAISQFNRPFPKGDWADVRDMNGILYRNIHINSIKLFNTHNKGTN